MPIIDTSVKASGSGSMKFTIMPNSGSDDSGTYFTNFSNNLATQFGSGQEFYIQWRQRFTPEYINTAYAGGAGFKNAIITEGDRTGVTVSSCKDIGIIMQDVDYLKFPQLYHSCGSKLTSSTTVSYEPLQEQISNPIDWYLQNGIRGGAGVGCLFSSPAAPPCAGYKPNQWMTFQVHVKIGTWYTNNLVFKHDSTVQMWVAEEGKPSVLALDFSPQPGAAGLACQQQSTISVPACQTGYDLYNSAPGVSKFGKIWLTPYNTGKVSTVTYPVAYTWYDELIISTNKIPDPQ